LEAMIVSNLARAFDKRHCGALCPTSSPNASRISAWLVKNLRSQSSTIVSMSPAAHFRVNRPMLVVVFELPRD
jgi:hypothetical protein